MSNTPDFLQPEYKAHAKQVKLVNDIYCGVDTAKAYLSQFNREEPTIYTQRQSDATLDNFVLGTVQTIKNIIFRKPITRNITNTLLDTWLDTIDLKQNINEFAKDTLVNKERDGFTYILVEAPIIDSEKITNKAQQEAENIRPYFVNILRSNVLNWKLDKFGNYERVSIREQVEIQDGAFGVKIVNQIKVLYNDGRVQIWKENEENPEEYIRGVKEITLIKIGKDSTPKFYGMAKINIVQFNRNSELDNYVRVGGAPFLATFGTLDVEDGETVTLGINQGLTFSDSDSDAKWIEMSGSNAEMIENRISKHNEQMLNIAIEFVSKDNTNKTATEIQANKTEDESKLTDSATELQEGLNQAIELMSLYKLNTSFENQTLEVNKDFDSNVLTPEQASAYRLDYTQGIISLERLWELYERGEYYPTTTEEEKAKEKSLISDADLGE